MFESLQQGRECYGRRAWGEAYRLLASADRAKPLQSEDLERLATAAYLVGQEVEFQRLLVRLHRLYLQSNDRSRAARCAFWLGIGLLLRGEIGQANAWVARGQRLVEHDDCAERGYLLVPVAEQQLQSRNAAAAYATAAQAASLGERLGEADLTAAARHIQGRALIKQGQVSAGLVLLDETMLAVVGGELSPIMTGLMYCSVIEACRDAYAWSRAREWTNALAGWCEQQSEMVAFTGACLVHRAEIMQFHGTWSDAMAEACRACERAQLADRSPPAAAWYQRAEVHRLQGEYAEAEEAYRHANQLGCEPQPGLALLRMAQGRNDAARAAIDRLLSSISDPPRRARLLPAYIEIMLGTGETDRAGEACHELQELAESLDADVLRAAAAQARGAIELADGDPRAAARSLRRAFAMWQQIDAPYESATVRMLMALACRALGDVETSVLELDAARIAFERLGARPKLAELDSLSTPESSRRCPLTDRELHVLRLIAAGNTNKTIASTLRLSERTVDRHVSNILCKLDVPSRAAATAYAYDHKLL